MLSLRNEQEVTNPLIVKWKEQKVAMTSANNGRPEVPSQTANRLRDGWLNDRKQGLAAQLAANIEVRRRWMESDTGGQEETISEGD